MPHVTFEELIAHARTTYRERSDIPPNPAPIGIVRTAVWLLEESTRTRSITPVADAVAMLEEMLEHLCADGAQRIEEVERPEKPKRVK